MTHRNSSLCLVVLGALAAPAFATSGTTIVGGEAGLTTHAMPSTVTRAQVRAELEAWRKNPVTADGWREVGGEVGWVYVGAPRAGAANAAAEAVTPSKATTSAGAASAFRTKDGVVHAAFHTHRGGR